ncbi:SPOC domain-like protein [Guyanagaster necrorhizus]|uniref:ATP-dependent DNA helicase II subunit 2 n=1 Tax=Guyanagaster necrorhizus TaxID=856835 RepID=A0A9P8AWP7_9AGAR|nr:SPOC domain-like protein [Guyanagaster necrorhizus MCA 3950]KAG7450798.1 SPOC domain-like protein [Guyanagaster necrorhizus MCA 3950]
MPAERAGYTVTMFLVDISKSSGKTRIIDLLEGPNGEERTAEITNLQWGLQYVKLKIQEMIYNGRKTDQCGVIIFGSEDTDNIVNQKNGGYENVFEYIHIAQPNAATLAKLDQLEPSETTGDPIDCLIVGIETQADHLGSKKTWTRKIILVTDGENPIEIEDWEATVKKLNELDISLTIVGIDFDDEEFPYAEEDKSNIKRVNENFYKQFIDGVEKGVLGTCAYALQDISRPDIRQTKSVLMGTILRLGDVDTRPEEALEIMVKTSKCTAINRPKSWKKFSMRKEEDEEGPEPRARKADDGEEQMCYAQLKQRTEYFVDKRDKDEDGDVEMEEEEEEIDDGAKKKDPTEGMEAVDKEALVRGFKYGSSYAPCPDGQFPRLHTKKGIEINGFFPKKNFRRELSMGEIQYIWGDPSSPQQQVALSSIVQAMYEKGVVAIARWVSKDGMDPKMGVLSPMMFDKVDCLLWAQMPFADDVRKYAFASLDHLVNKKREAVQEHPYLPNEEQLEAMDNFVDAMDVMTAGERDDEGNREPWFDTRYSYNPAIHRVKQAMFHCAVVPDIETNPLSPPHPELLKYFEPPRKVVKRAHDAIEEVKTAFKVKEVPKKVARARKDGHVHARDDDEEMLLLDRKGPATVQTQSHLQIIEEPTASSSKANQNVNENDSATEEEEEDLLDKAPSKKGSNLLPTPARSISPQVDPGREPGRIVGTTYPLNDFQRNLTAKDLVTKAVEDLAYVITEIVMRPFSSRRTNELIQCMRVMRDTCLNEDEIDAWNEFLMELKKKCNATPGNLEFWGELQNIGRPISLISDEEAREQGGESENVTESKAKKFFN